MSIFFNILIPSIAFLLGMVVGFFIAYKIFQSQMKNMMGKMISEDPGLQKERIESMMGIMGKKPSAYQLNKMFEEMKKVNFDGLGQLDKLGIDQILDTIGKNKKKK